MSSIIDTARRLREEILASGLPSAVGERSVAWQEVHERIHRPMILECSDPHELVRRVTEENAFTFPRHTDDPACRPIAWGYLDWLEGFGAPLEGLDERVQESPLVGKRTLFRVRGRLLSTMFLFHLCEATRVLRHVGQPRNVLEIGPGYGGLARVLKLLSPGTRYTLLDLPDSLTCSYVFLATHFPEARLLFVTGKGQMDAAGDADFVFLPTTLVEELHGRETQLAINTCSFGEMTQPVIDRYLDLLQHRMQVRWLYSLNRYGQYPEPMPGVARAGRACPPDGCHTALPLDRDWHPVVWDLWGEEGFSQIEVFGPPHLEVLAERRSMESELAYRNASASLLARARGLEGFGAAWHDCLWNSIRYHPNRDNLGAYLARVEPLGFPEAEGYRQLLEGNVERELGLDAPELEPPVPGQAPEVRGPSLVRRVARRAVRELRQRLCP
jgi:hypothetical protein